MDDNESDNSDWVDNHNAAPEPERLPHIVHDFIDRLTTGLFEDSILRPRPDQDGDDPTHRHSHQQTQQNQHPRHTHPQLPASPLTARLLPFIDAVDPALGMADDLRFCVEDTVSLKNDKFMVGVVDRSFGDVDSHEPRPQRDYAEDIERDDDIPKDQFAKFMKSGIPPRGTVLVSWQTVFRTELIPEAKLELLDRALYVGDVVKRNTQDPMSGTVIGTKAVCTLFPATLFNSGQLTTPLTEEHSIRGVPADELLNVHEYQEGALVIYDNWVGRIEDVYDEVAVKLSNNSVVVVESPDDLEPVDQLVDRLSVGDFVKTKKLNLRRGRWRYGAYDPRIRPEGTVVETRAVMINVQWLAAGFGIGGSNSISTKPEPPAQLYTDELESENFTVYDASRGAVSTLPLMPNGLDRSYHVAEVTVGDRVRFKDLTGAAVKYDGTHSLPSGHPQGKVKKIPRTETLGYDMNVYLVMQTQSQVTVLWQDLSITEAKSSSLIPDPNVEDDDEVWPGEIVCTKEQKSDKAADETWTFQPAKVGVVQSVKPRDRIATVRWFENSSISFMGDDLLPPSYTGNLLDATEEVSLYDIRSTPSLTRRRGDFVLIHSNYAERPQPESMETGEGHLAQMGKNEWFGEVIDLCLDGKITVRLGAARPVVDVRVPAERVTLVYSSDMENQFDIGPTLEGDSVDFSDDDDDDDDDASNFGPSSFREVWVEYEGMDGEPIGNINEEDWSTEDEDADEDDDTDEDMPDLVPINGVDTSKTTPESESDGEPNETGIQVNSISFNIGSSPQHDHSLTEAGVLTTTQQALMEASQSLAPEPFLILDTNPPADHHYLESGSASSASFMRRIAKEHKILRSSLPPGIFVRTWESRTDLIRVLIIGPLDTPYEFAPFIIDFHLPSHYPSQAPSAYFHSWTNGNGPVNPNLYEDGKICLSLLGTWHADERNESWSPSKSTLLQVLVSLMGLVLVKEPYYNEAGYDVHRSTPETKLASALYTERAYFRSRAFIAHALENKVEPFTEELRYLYRSTEDGAPQLLERAIGAANEVLERSDQESDGSERDGLRRISRGAVVMLKRQVEKLVTLRVAGEIVENGDAMDSS